MKVDIAKAFRTEGESVADLMQERGVGYYIPLYQREYSWDRENVEQMFEDISRGVESLIDPDQANRANAIHFLGTVLLVAAHAREDINPRDEKAIPARVDIVIDGQQRLSTLAMIAALLYQRVARLGKRLPDDHELNDQVKGYLEPLLEMFTYDLHRGSPQRKPLIIRGSIDGWTLSGPDDQHYRSEIALYLARVIRAIATNTDYPALPTGNSRAASVLRVIHRKLQEIEDAHKEENSTFPTAWQLAKTMSQDELWGYKRDEFCETVVELEGKMFKEWTALERRVVSLTQLFAFCHFLLQRCCLTVIRPSEDRWAFDMFQSLNATGTPLTAVETFKPLVVNQAMQDGFEYKGSQEEASFNAVDKLLSQGGTAAAKTKATNQYLTTVAAAYDGMKLPTRFSAQRKWLIDAYDARADLEDRRRFVQFMGDVARYFSGVVEFDPEHATPMPGVHAILNEAERELATMCVLYLRDAGHTIAHSVLSRFHAQTIDESGNAPLEFGRACKAIAAFFTLWRAASNNTGLDDVYRTALSEHMGWVRGNGSLMTSALKEYFMDRLEERGLGSKGEWLNRTGAFLRYDQAKQVCKFALFVTAQDTIPDDDEPGLMMEGAEGVTPPYLRPSAWISSSFRTIEHVAPRRPLDEGQWDEELYRTDNVQRIGNLTLLPTDVNSSAGNKRWVDKWIYYRHLAEQNPTKLDELRVEAEQLGVPLSSGTLDLLRDATFKHHITPLIKLGASGPWDHTLVEKRSERIASILWDRVITWLQ